MLRRLLAPANGPDRSLRAVGPYIEIGHQSAPDRQFPHAPFGSWFVSQIIPAAPNARRGPAPASQHTATHNHAPRGRVTGSQRTPNRQGVALGVTDWPRWCAPFRPLPPASGFDQGGQTLASQRPQTQSTVPACAWPHAGTFVATSGDLNWPCRELSRGHELLL